MTPAVHEVVVVGAGVVGLSVALYLAEAGKRVVLIDRKGIALEASYGNAGALAFSDILPMASPGLVRQALKWLVDPLGPLSIPPAYLPRIAPWLIRLWRASGRERYAASTRAQAALMALARQETPLMLKRAGLDWMVRSDGVLHLYEGGAQYAASLPGWKLRDDHGIESQAVTGSALDELQPGLSPQFTHAQFVPGWKTVSDPHELAQGIGRAALRKGAQFILDEAVGLTPDDRGVTLTLAAGNVLRAEQVVVACGAWSGRLARQIGDSIPLETERGYNTTLPCNAFDLRRQLTFGGHGFVITPLSTGIRVGGAVELGGLVRKPNYRRCETMLTKAKKFLPALKTDGGTQWMGFRPSLPDTLPVIGRSPRTSKLIYAFGHGHLGLTQAAATGRLVSDMILNRPCALSLHSFRPDRF
ncbi:MAG: FAD-dependent oxidoreductase [Paralcaligenes sp.]